MAENVYSRTLSKAERCAKERAIRRINREFDEIFNTIQMQKAL